MMNDKEKLDDEKDIAESAPVTPPNEQLPTMKHEDEEAQADRQVEDSPSSLQGTFKLAVIASFVMTFVMDFLVSISHYLVSSPHPIISV